MRPAACVVLCALALVSCDDRPTTWKAFVYPDIENMDRFVAMDGFKDFESCQTAAINVRNFTGGAIAGDYICGYRCGFKAEYGMEICKEKRK
ncbi:hypothetical protein LJR164_001603 [Phenylobacterium sp. LjRoot164]|uniref:hypothetical protein n=1 Tax=unclassified Phenylobacterium TaxID=2640670 RepID=UPI003ED17013